MLRTRQRRQSNLSQGGFKKRLKKSHCQINRDETFSQKFYTTVIFFLLISWEIGEARVTVTKAQPMIIIQYPISSFNYQINESNESTAVLFLLLLPLEFRHGDETEWINWVWWVTAASKLKSDPRKIKEFCHHTKAVCHKHDF